MAKKLDFSDLKGYRKSLGLNQSDFWTRFGVTQSGGSRYENQRDLPEPTAMLLWLHAQGMVSDEQLQKAAKAIAKR